MMATRPEQLFAEGRLKRERNDGRKAPLRRLALAGWARFAEPDYKIKRRHQRRGAGVSRGAVAKVAPAS